MIDTNTIINLLIFSENPVTKIQKYKFYEANCNNSAKFPLFV